MHSKSLIALALTGSSLSPVLASAENPRPRGVGPEFAKYYKDKTSFSCILNPHIILPASAINDDFCDCPDGSDEPGTSACSHLLLQTSPPISDNINHTFALPGYYCKNKGHRPAYASFTLVNDGICDYAICCDGSDEWAGTGGVKCEDRCASVGAKAKSRAAVHQKLLASAMRKRAELVSQAETARLELENKVATLGAGLVTGASKVIDAERKLAEAEEEDKLRVRREGTQGAKLVKLRDLTKERIQELKNYLGIMKQQKYDAEWKLRELENILATFKEEYNPNFNDEGVKRAAKAWEEYESKGRHVQDYAQESKAEELVRDDDNYGIVWSDYENVETDGSLYSFEAYLPPSVRVWINSQLDTLRSFLIKNGILPDNSGTSSGNESRAVTDARAALDAINSERSNWQTEIDNAENDLRKDYGPNDIFRALKDVCETIEVGEYVYEHCYTRHTTQKPQRGGSDTNMGNFMSIELIDSEPPAAGEDDVESDVLRTGVNKKIALKYENGQQCWNGPQRSTLVVLSCSEQSKLWRVVEEEKCVYRMEGGSPAACLGEMDAGNVKPKEKDEL